MILGIEFVALADGLKETSKDSNVGGVLGGADSDTFLFVNTPVAIFVFLNAGDEVGLGLGEVENPGVGGIEIVGLNKAKRDEFFGGEGVSGFDANEEGVVVVGERFQRGEGGSEGIGGIISIKGGAVGAIEIISEWSRMENGKILKIRFFDKEGLVAFELRKMLPFLRL